MRERQLREELRAGGVDSSRSIQALVRIERKIG
jgi:hypothetical protein